MGRPDLTVLAIPGFVGAMAAEYAWLRRHPAPTGVDGQPEDRPGDYELHDTIASLAMGVGSLIAPFVTGPALRRIAPGTGRWGTALLAVGAGAAVATTVGDVLRMRREHGRLPEAGTVPGGTLRGSSQSSSRLRVRESGPVHLRVRESGPVHVRGRETEPVHLRVREPELVRSRADALSRLTRGTAVAAVASAALASATVWTTQTSATRLSRHAPFAVEGRWALPLAVLGWDAIYYWNHRLSHEVRWLWAVHVVHHSSERYNLSTALRQPVAEGLTMAVPYGLLALLGLPPRVIEDARALNLIYQFWIHTEAIRSIGWLEKVLNTPSHHRAHHGSQRQYLDINHGSILIVWDKLFGTFEPEDERVRYGLTTNIETFDLATIATHEWQDIVRDVAGARTWSDRFGFLLRGPGWAYERRAELEAGAAPPPAAPLPAEPLVAG